MMFDDNSNSMDISRMQAPSQAIRLDVTDSNVFTRGNCDSRMSQSNQLTRLNESGMLMRPYMESRQQLMTSQPNTIQSTRQTSPKPSNVSVGNDGQLQLQLPLRTFSQELRQQ